MSETNRAVKGTCDVLPSESYKWQFVEKRMLETARLYGFNEIRIPVFEHTEVFLHSVGDTTDVVQKEMYTFDDKGGRSITLRPEFTAGVIRSAIEKGLVNGALPVKAAYVGGCYRYEKPQAGRLREFHQFGVECIGAASPSADAEVIALAKHVLDAVGIEKISLEINSIGCPECRKDYLEKVKECLTNLNITYEVNPRIVRGLDYYTRTVFEFVSGDIGAQSTVCGGGRYDGLISQMGGPSTASLGFAMGIERIMLLLEAQGTELPRPDYCDLYIATMGENAGVAATGICELLRKDGFKVQTDICGRGLKAQMKFADKTGARFTMVLGDNECESGNAKIKNMQSGEETEIRLNEISESLMNIINSAALDELAESIL